MIYEILIRMEMETPLSTKIDHKERKYIINDKVFIVFLEEN